MGMVKKVKKLIFNSNFSFYFKFLAINGTEKTRLCPQLVIEFLGGCPQLVTEICGGCPQLVTEKVRLSWTCHWNSETVQKSRSFSDEFWTVLLFQWQVLDSLTFSVTSCGLPPHISVTSCGHPPKNSMTSCGHSLVLSVPLIARNLK